MISIECRDKIEIITFSIDKINALIVEEIKPQIIKVFDNPNTKVIIDLKGVEYIDSSGFGCFLSALKAARSNYGILKLANPEPSVKKLFEILHLHTIFEIFDNTESCINSFKNSAH
jgi:anti-sigma B factor antagonist